MMGIMAAHTEVIYAIAMIYRNSEYSKVWRELGAYTHFILWMHYMSVQTYLTSSTAS